MTRIYPSALLFLIVILLCGCLQSQPQTSSPAATPFPGVTPEVTTPVVSPAATPDETLGGPVRFVPGGEYHVGDTIILSGTTILSPGNELLIEVSELAFSPTNKTEDTAFSGASAIVTVGKGSEDSRNTWSYTLDTTGFAPGDYQVLITGIQVTGFQKSAYFTLLPVRGS
jgi:hypothetical protein